MHRLRPGDRRRRRTPLSRRPTGPHVALAAAFVALGAVDGAWAARLPALQHRLRLDSGRLGLVIFSVSAAATLLLPVAGWLASRFGSRGPTGLGLVVAAVGLTFAAFAPSLALLVPAACVLGAGTGILDVGANAHGVAVEKRAGRPILSALHGTWSFGLLGGSGLAAGAAASGIGPRVQFPVVAAATLLLAAIVVPRLLPGAADAAVDTAHFALPRGALALPAFLTFCCMFVESATMNWSAVFLAGPVRTSAALAAGGVVAFSIAMAFARLVGDRFVARWGFAGLARVGGLLTFAGMTLALATRSPIPALAGFACVGAGCAAIVPALFRIAASAPGVSSGAGIAAVATAGYTGGVVNGPVIGFVARGIGLSSALGIVAVAGLLIAGLGHRLGR
ncbi:MAG TPA: MFS transporter [Gaiellaceae bacterium]|nr:MFS transporter [Gaiellaceae bacterium]